jgi:glycogen synthase
MYPSVSIVINTLNRGPDLHRLLKSLRWIDYRGDFEVIVVNGPSTDNSNEVIETWAGTIRAEKCDVANLSVSRNIGICTAQGDIVAFIDDDAIPEPEWLSQLVEPYRDPQVAGSGGFVFNHTGYGFQYQFATVDRFANADLSPTSPTPELAFPKSYHFPHLLGCNSSFRRSVLIEVKGFDEEFDYFLDETDLCLRVIDAGYIIAQLSGAYVHHKFAASNIRRTNRVAHNRYPVLKNKLYFMLKHAREYHSIERILAEQGKFVEAQRNEVGWAVREGYLSADDEIRFAGDVERSFEVGLKRGLEGPKAEAAITTEKLEKYRHIFRKFNAIDVQPRKAIAIISRDFPPDHGGGIATFNKNLAEDLAELGHTVHVVTQSADINRVDFENGVWVHRIVVREVERSQPAIDRRIPPHIWNWSSIALSEVARISTHREIDAVEATIWDCEGAAFLFEGKWPLITSLATTLHFYLDYHPEQKSDPTFMASFGAPMLRLEREMMTKAEGIRANSRAIVDEIERAYGFAFNRISTVVIPNGILWKPLLPVKRGSGSVEILFVGRLEKRKGIDILLSAIPLVTSVFKNVNFTLVGEDSLRDSSGMTFKDRFLQVNSGNPCIRQTVFAGRISDEALRDAYASCDIFVAPSLFESYGLVFVEAMREGKPVVGCDVGGVPEVVSDGVNGILVKPDDPRALADALIRLVEDRILRSKMGETGRRMFEERFTSRRTAEQSLAMYDSAKARYRAKR